MLVKMIKERERYMDDLKCETKEKCSGLDDKLDEPKPKKNHQMRILIPLLKTPKLYW